jgi:hypothetical protein
MDEPWQFCFDSACNTGIAEVIGILAVP